ncbi:hypothetical protein BO70DRAFT_232183 [Aspergillus heteromorphus CBS 117.55]|uniref:Rhodopsin domain-containing protein n=1 Tax=Aspergillus heteromorphus CBS 117.55 TaxID=1448321 RepID=A0A317WF24_9EURO|nr:uncharacterized protein BO70DRAFT_232183 [Aspergillus heteromorphus CBS 117.55]PWY85003.1 hypothetical protein BO70DRAFT_232183 [Aspergillus heteromorphus CBS 117.55]
MSSLIFEYIHSEIDKILCISDIDLSTTPATPVVTVTLAIVSVIFPILSLLSILLRFRARPRCRLQLKGDDWWILAAWLSTLGISITIWVYGGIAGITQYKMNIVEGMRTSLECLFVLSLILQVSLSTVKISILFLYKRIFATNKFQIISWISIALVVIWGFTFFCLIMFARDPTSGSWTGRGRFRFNVISMGMAQSTTSIAIDFAVLLLPMPMLLSLQMPAQRKIGIMLIFWLGAFCCIAAIIRYFFLRKALASVGKGYGAVQSHVVILRLESNQAVFMVLEPNCSIIAACLPCYGNLFRDDRCLGSMVRNVWSIFSTRSQNSHHGYGYRTETESQIELTQDSARWQAHEGQRTRVKGGGMERRGDEERAECASPGIRVQTRVEVTESMR